MGFARGAYFDWPSTRNLIGGLCPWGASFKISYKNVDVIINPESENLKIVAFFAINFNSIKISTK